MERRRFIPRSENMEGRMMLSTATAALPAGAATLTAEVAGNTPYTIQQKQDRIDRVPRLLRSFSPNRALPKEMVEGIQQGLEGVVSKLDPANPETSQMFNSALRDIVSRPSLRAGDAHILEQRFTDVLVSAGADASSVDLMASNLNLLATTINTSNVEPVFLTTNDYASILQLALIVGQPMPAPTAPGIARTSGTRVDAFHNVTPESQPTFIGTYQPNAVIQILNQDNDQVLGSEKSGSNGQYTIKFDVPLEVGTYTLRARAVDELGHQGALSRPFMLKVVAPKATPAAKLGQATPEGPLASMRS